MFRRTDTDNSKNKQTNKKLCRNTILDIYITTNDIMCWSQDRKQKE